MSFCSGSFKIAELTSIQAPRSIAIFGNDAGNPTEGFYNQDNYEFGNLVVGGGSGTGRLTYLDTPLDALKRKAYEDGALLQQWLNNTLIAESDVTDLWIAPEPEVCIVMLKTWAEEADDRESLGFDWNGEAVVNSVAKACGNTVVVTHSAGINLYPFADHPNVTAIIAAHCKYSYVLKDSSHISETDADIRHLRPRNRERSVYDRHPLRHQQPIRQTALHRGLRWR